MQSVSVPEQTTTNQRKKWPTLKCQPSWVLRNLKPDRLHILRSFISGLYIYERIFISINRLYCLRLTTPIVWPVCGGVSFWGVVSFFFLECRCVVLCVCADMHFYWVGLSTESVEFGGQLWISKAIQRLSSDRFVLLPKMFKFKLRTCPKLGSLMQFFVVVDRQLF